MTAPTPAERRGYPLPPWAAAESPAEHNGADVLEYLLGLTTDGLGLNVAGIRQAEAYLDAWLDRHRAAQDVASRCLIEGHTDAVDELAGLRTELRDARVAVRDAYDAGHAAGVELAAARQYVDGHLPDDVVELLELVERADVDELEARASDVRLGNCGRACPCESSS